MKPLLSSRTLERLKIPAGETVDVAAIYDAAIELGLIPTRDHKLDPMQWNKVIDLLDTHHPGWRGYSVTYRSGRVG